MTPTDERIEGRFGSAEPLDLPVQPSGAETVCHWLLTAPAYHPVWSQYILCAVRLTDGLPGFPEPHHQFEGSTHELLVVVLNPEHGPQTAGTICQAVDDDRGLPFLMPVNICEQFIATDDEICKLVSMAAQAVVHGVLNPDTDGRSAWLPSMTKTLAHIRGEQHAQ